MTEEGEAPWDDGAMTRCTHCYKDTAIWGHDGKCPTCIAATSNFGKDMTTRITSSDCGCEIRNGRQFLCSYHEGYQDAINHQQDLDVANGEADPHGACKETIKAREREANDLRYRVREKDRAYVTLFNKYMDMKGKKELAEHQVEGMRQVQYDLEEERDQWKSKAERAELEYQNALQDGSICPDPDAHKNTVPTRWCCYHGRWEEPEQWNVTSSVLKHATFSTVVHTTDILLGGVNYCYCGGRWHRVGEVQE